MTKPNAPAIATHGAAALPAVTVDNYNIEIKDEDGFIGDRANKGAFLELIDTLRKVTRKTGEDPIGDEETEELSKKQLDRLLTRGDANEAAIVHGAIEEFSHRLASVIKRYLKSSSWRDTEAIVIGGGLRESRIGELIIARTSMLLAADKHKLKLFPIKHHPDEAGLIGAAHLAPSWMFRGHDAIVGVDIGGTNIRAGIVRLGKKGSLKKIEVVSSELWRHADDEPDRKEAIETLVAMLERLIKSALKKRIALAPFIGIGCPGMIDEDGAIGRGAQNLPGNWSSKDFHLPAEIIKAIPTIDKEQTAVLIHNDAVVQGLSEMPRMADVKRWGVLTIGTGLGNARFTNREAAH
jgi:predicted NBD/HSP70 family sugar kinase